MAATGSGGGGAPPFSIRGFAARARAGAADEGDRCWPLGGEAGPLPPIEVRRFRWWADEAKRAKEVVVEEEEEERRKAAMCRKRSVVELFAAVPRVAPTGDGRRVRRKVDKGKLPAGVLPSKAGFSKDKAPSSENAARKKEKSGNVKVVSLSISQLFQDAIQKRKLKKSSSKKKKNQEVSVLLNKKIVKGSKKSVLSNQKVIKSSSEVQTILKKHLRTGEGVFLKKSDACPSKSSLKSKHVTFSDADDICELTASHPRDNTEQSQVVQASQQTFQRDSSQSNKEEPHLVHQRIDATSETVEQDSSSLSEKVGSSGASHTVPLTNSKEKTMMSKSMDLNHCIEISKRGNVNRLSSPATLSSQGLAQKFVDVDFPVQEGLYLGIGRQAEENRRIIPQGSSAAAGLAHDTRPGNFVRIPLPQPSSSCYVASLREASDRNRKTIPQERLVANCHLTEVQSSVVRSGNDMVSSINTSTGSSKSTDAQATDSVSACRNISFSGGYMGLPLNSHGEFVRVQPGGTLNPDELFKRQCLGQDSLHPSTSPTFVTPNACLDYSHLRINHQGQAPPFFTVANFGIQPDTHLNPKVPTAYSMGFRQSASSQRMEVHNYAVSSNNYSCSNQQASSEQCSCAQCLGHDNQLQKSLQMQSCFPRQNYEQNMQPAVDTTMRLMGKTVNLGTSSKQCGGLDNWGPCSSKQIRAEDHYFPGMRTQAFPQLFLGGLVDLRTRIGVSNGGRTPSEYVSCFSSVPAAEQGSGFRESNHSQQPQLAVPNKASVQPVSRYNEVGLVHQRPAVQVGRVQSTATHLQPGAVDCRGTPSVPAMSYYDPWNKFKNFVETTPRPPQSSFFPRNSSNMAQRPPAAPIMSGYSVQSTPAVTTPTKFTSLRPLPPSMVSSHVYSSEGAQPHGSTPFHPPAPFSSQPGKVSAPGAIIKDKGMKQAPIGSNLESSKQMDRSFKRPVGKDNGLLALPKKPSIAVVGKNPNQSPLPEKGIDPCGSTPHRQPQYIPVRLSTEPEKNLRVINNDTPTRTAWTESVNSVGTRPVQLKSGAKHILQPCASASMDQEDSWPVHSVVQFEVENNSCTVAGSSKKID
ncbi:uncharacterized protein LOC124705394 [Lolium rigidum]|uniref:uncharacterized protein LOC124705394 n=1 Tax=Lolium rigidum TaxID=89674 RepID=UPI001F5D37F0|nr:uncharacterized protein LOC124705394 [Lolium rigidum]